MKILQVNTYDISGGAARAAYRLHRGLLQIEQDSRMLVKYKDSTDNSVFCISPENPARKFGEELFLSTVIQNHYINSHRTDISNTIFSLPYPGYDLSVLPLVQAADVVNLHWVAYYQSPITLHRLFALGKPVVWTLHDQWAFTGGCHYTAGCERYRRDCVACPQLADDPFHLPAAVLQDKLELFRGANLTIVTPSRWLAACARDSRLFKGLRAEVIPYSLETDIFSPLPKAEAKESVGLNAEIFTLLFVAHVGNERRKGFRELIAAIQFCLHDSDFQDLVKSGKVRLLCLGWPSDDVEVMGIPVVSLGYLNSDKELRAAYAAADIFVLPSLEDNLPNTMLESMSCGTPVVAYDVGGIPDAVVNGVTGRLAPPGDIRKLGEAILSLVFNPDQREIMGQNCRKLAVEEYSLPVQARRYAELYRELYQEYEMSAQVAPENLTPEPDEIQVPVATPQTETLPVFLETAAGPYFRDVYDQVLFKALKEFSIAKEKGYQVVREQLRQREDQIRQQREHLRQREDQIRQQREQLQQREDQIRQQREQLQRQDNQLGQLAFENEGLKLELRLLRNSWSWKITEPLRKVGAFGIAVKDVLSRRGARPYSSISGDAPIENSEVPKSG